MIHTHIIYILYRHTSGNKYANVQGCALGQQVLLLRLKSNICVLQAHCCTGEPHTKPAPTHVHSSCKGILHSRCHRTAGIFKIAQNSLQLPPGQTSLRMGCIFLTGKGRLSRCSAGHTYVRNTRPSLSGNRMLHHQSDGFTF